MKTKNLFKSLFLSLVAVAFFSCGGSDGGGSTSSGAGSGTGGGTTNQTTSITISANVNTIEIGESVAFLVNDNNGVNKTALSKVFVDGVELSGSVFTPTLVGSYNVYATFETFTSATISVTVNAATVNTVIVGSDSYALLPGERFTFSAFANGTTNVTDDATFFVDGNEISDNTYISNERGNFSITATYESVTSNAINVAAGYVKKVLIEDYTGTWCGYCPRLAYNLEDAENQSAHVYGVAVHNGSSNPMTYEHEALMRAQFSFSGWPTGRLNRASNWNESVSSALNAVGVSPVLGLGLESSLSGSTISVDVKVGYIAATSDTKLVAFLLEDGKVYPQVNYYNSDTSSPWYGTGNPIPNYVHNNILRKAFTDVLGDVMPNGTIGGEYTQTLTMEMPSSIENENELQIVVFVVDTNGVVINAMRVDLGESQDYQ